MHNISDVQHGLYGSALIANANDFWLQPSIKSKIDKPKIRKLSIILALTVMLSFILGVLIKIHLIKRSEPEGSDYEYKKHHVCFLSEDLPQIYQFGKKFAAVANTYDTKDFFRVFFYGIFTDEETFGNIPV